MPRPSRQTESKDLRLLATLLLSLALLPTLTGCRRPHLVLPQIAMTPVDLEPIPEPAEPPVIAEEPTPEPPVPVSPPPVVIVRRRPAPPRETQPPTQTASAEPEPEPEPGVAAIGELSSGGDTTPQTQQAAKDLIAQIEKRLAVLPAASANQQRNQIRQVRLFLKQAKQALASGDAEAAKTLATKAKLIMDDVEKK